jgi:hypothetical protein
MKASDDAQSGIMLRLELVESKESTLVQAYSEMPPHVGYVLRLTEPWFPMKRVIVADGGFALVKVTKEVELRGNRFLGIVKTCSRGYPKAQFKIWGNQVHERGDHKVYETMIDGKRVYALGWYAKPNLMKTFIASTYSTLPGEPIRVLRTNQAEEDGKLSIRRELR